MRSGIVATDPTGVSDHDWTDLMTVVRDQRIAGYARAAHAHGYLTLTSQQHDVVDSAHREAMVVAIQLESMLVAIVEHLRGVDIAVRVMKGPAAAHLDYPSAELRSFGDVDLLVRSEAFDAAVESLRCVGSVRRFDEPRAGFTAKFGKGVCLVAPNGFEIDVHRAFVAGPFAVAASPNLLWETSSTFELGGSQITALGYPARLLGAAVHAVLGRREPRLVPVRDLAQMLANPTRSVDEVIELAGRLQLHAVLARAILMVNAMLELDRDALPGSEWAFQYQATRRDRDLIRCYTAANRSYALQARAAVRATPGVRAKSAYIRALAFPGRDYLDARDGSYRRRVARALKVGKGTS